MRIVQLIMNFTLLLGEALETALMLNPNELMVHVVRQQLELSSGGMPRALEKSQ